MKRIIIPLLALIILTLGTTPAQADHTPEHSYQQLATYCQTHDTPSCTSFWAAHSPLPSISGTWVQDFSDEFTSGSTPLAGPGSKWKNGWFAVNGDGFSDPVNSQMDACNSTDNVARYLGVVILAITPNTDPDCERRDGTTAPYAGALINTDPNQLSPGWQDDNGVFEWRMFYPGPDDDCDGGDNRVNNWPTGWTTGQDHPNTGEVDTAEVGSDGMVRTNIHYAINDDDVDRSVGSDEFCGQGWHTYTLHRSSTQCTTYRDGVVIETFTQCANFAGDPHFAIFENTTDVDDSGRIIDGTNSELLGDYFRHWSAA